MAAKEHKAFKEVVEKAVRYSKPLLDKLREHDLVVKQKPITKKTT